MNESIETEFDLPGVSEYLGMLLDIVPPTDHPADTYIDDIKIAMPVELELVEGDKQQRQLRMSPPTQTTETSVYPVLHAIKLHVVAERNE